MGIRVGLVVGVSVGTRVGLCVGLGVPLTLNDAEAYAVLSLLSHPSFSGSKHVQAPAVSAIRRVFHTSVNVSVEGHLDLNIAMWTVECVQRMILSRIFIRTSHAMGMHLPSQILITTLAVTSGSVQYTRPVCVAVVGLLGSVYRPTPTPVVAPIPPWHACVVVSSCQSIHALRFDPINSPTCNHGYTPFRCAPPLPHGNTVQHVTPL